MLSGLSNLDAETWILWVHAAFVWYVVLLVLCLALCSACCCCNITVHRLSV